MAEVMAVIPENAGVHPDGSCKLVILYGCKAQPALPCHNGGNPLIDRIGMLSVFHKA